MARDGLARMWRDNWLFVTLVGALTAAFLLLRTPASPVKSLTAVDALLSGGRPVLVVFYSNT